MDNQENFLIEIKDKYGECLSDKIGKSSKKINDNRPNGFVEIFDVTNDEKKLVGKHNLVVYTGREWLISSAFNVSNTNIDSTASEFICWFGAGDGGCPIGDPLNPTAPTMEDSDLSNSIMINATDSDCADYRSSPTAGYYKHPLDSVNYEQDPDNYNYWLIGRVETTLAAADANDYNISEAGLFTATSNAGGHTGNFTLYARVTFPTIVKSSGRQLLFVWYVYF